jgi:hypothetical protein
MRGTTGLMKNRPLDTIMSINRMKREDSMVKIVDKNTIRMKVSALTRRETSLNMRQIRSGSIPNSIIETGNMVMTDLNLVGSLTSTLPKASRSKMT